MPHDLPPPPPLPPGTLVASRFIIEQQAGRGGMGIVYRASDSLSGQQVALKLLHVDGGDSLQLSHVLLTQGRAAEAREVAALGVQRLEQCASEGAYAVGIHLALAEACLADGDTAAGEAALRKALICLRKRALDIPDEAAHQRFLLQVPENARTLELARQRWGEAEVS